MRAIISILIIALTVCVASAKDCGISLWNLVAEVRGIEATAMTTKQFRAIAAEEAAQYGLVYDMTATGNIAIIEAMCAARETRKVDTLINNALSTTVSIDTTGMSAFQVEYAVKECVKSGVEYTFTNGSVMTMQDSPVLAMQGTTCGISKTVVVDANGMSMTVPFSIESNDTTKYADDYEDFTVFSYRSNGVDLPYTDTIWHISNEVSYHVHDTIHSIDTVVSSFCSCEGQPMSVLWAQYMVELPKAIREEKDKGAKALLIGCRIKVGKIVRGEMRYGGKIEKDLGAIAPKSDVSYTAYKSLPEFCGYQQQSNKAKHKSSGLAQARAKQFWHRAGVWFARVFGSPCRK